MKLRALQAAAAILALSLLAVASNSGLALARHGVHYAGAGPVNSTGAPDLQCATLDPGGATVSSYNSAIPANATITGFTVVITAGATLNTTTAVFLMKDGVSVEERRIAAFPTATSTCETHTISLGGPTDLWGASWTPAEVNSASFGVDVRGIFLGSIFLDAVGVTVHYTVPSLDSKDDCKAGGWELFTRVDGSMFQNQGDCVRYVNTER